MSTTRAFLMAFGAAVAFSVPGWAQEPAVRLQVTPFIGGGLYLGEEPASMTLADELSAYRTVEGAERDDAIAAGVHAGVRIGRNLALEATFAYLPTTVTTTAGWSPEVELDTYAWGGSVLYYVPLPNGRVEPFLAAGLGGRTYDHAEMSAETDFMWNAGAGVSIALSPGTALRLEARDYMSSVDPEITGIDAELQHDLLLTAGISFTPRW